MTPQELKEYARMKLNVLDCVDNWLDYYRGHLNIDFEISKDLEKEIYEKLDQLITKAYKEGKKNFIRNEIETLEAKKSTDDPKKHDDYCAIRKYLPCDCRMSYYYLAIDQQIERFKKFL